MKQTEMIPERVLSILNDNMLGPMFAVSLFTSDNEMDKELIIDRIKSIDQILKIIKESKLDQLQNKAKWTDIFAKARNINIQDYRRLYNEDIEGIYAESSREQSSSNDQPQNV